MRSISTKAKYVIPDCNELGTVATIRAKSRVIPLGVDFQKFQDPELQQNPKKNSDYAPLNLWNHRWEYDKNPDEFFKALFVLNEQGLDYRVAILGESFRQNHPIFETARMKLENKIVHYGYAEEFLEFARGFIVPTSSR